MRVSICLHTYTHTQNVTVQQMQQPVQSVNSAQVLNTGMQGVQYAQQGLSNVPQQKPQPKIQKRSLDEEEIQIVASLLEYGLECFKLYSVRFGVPTDVYAEDYGVYEPHNSKQKGSSSSSSARHRSNNRSARLDANKKQEVEEKEILENFAAVFTVLDPRSFRDVFNIKMDCLFQAIVDRLPILSIPQHLLGNTHVSKIFADIALNYLVSRMAEMRGALHHVCVLCMYVDIGVTLSVCACE
jgi:hypothetical protein